MVPPARNALATVTGLRNFSSIVASVLMNLAHDRSVQFNTLIDSVVNHINDLLATSQQNDFIPLDPSDKNIQRRAYDVINIFMAIGFTVKDNDKGYRWSGPVYDVDNGFRSVEPMSSTLIDEELHKRHQTFHDLCKVRNGLTYMLNNNKDHTLRQQNDVIIPPYEVVIVRPPKIVMTKKSATNYVISSTLMPIIISDFDVLKYIGTREVPSNNTRSDSPLATPRSLALTPQTPKSTHKEHLLKALDQPGHLFMRESTPRTLTGTPRVAPDQRQIDDFEDYINH